jgi:hypothetical protein
VAILEWVPQTPIKRINTKNIAQLKENTPLLLIKFTCDTYSFLGGLQIFCTFDEFLVDFYVTKNHN